MEYTEADPVPHEHAPHRVLVVDDEPTVRALLVECLTLAGFEVCAAENVAEALAVVERSLVPVELALVDMHLPDGSGLGLVACLTRTRPRLPVILMSGSAEGDAEDPEVAAPYPLLVKPFSLGALVTAVRSAVE